jgi:hypothetical protein
MPIQTFAPMIFGTFISLIISVLVAAGSFFLLLRFQKWCSLLMFTGAIFGLLVRVISSTIGFLDMTQSISNSTYNSASEITYPLSYVANLCFAIGFVVTAWYLGQRITQMPKRDSVPL